jgi:PncC family amidohydrolase
VDGAGSVPGSICVLTAIGRQLRSRQLSLGVAESCSGGLLGSALTDLPGSSEFFRGGVVAYANPVKVALLGVRPETLEEHGAVSAQCAMEMACGLRRLLEVDVALALTGVAGPGGGTPEKPVGLVFAALAAPGGWAVRELRLGGSRSEIRRAAVLSVLEWLRRELEPGQEVSPDALIPS